MTNLKLYVDGKVVAEGKDIQPLTLRNHIDADMAIVIRNDGNELVIRHLDRIYYVHPTAYPGMEEKLSGLKPGDRLKLKYLDEAAI